MRTQQIDETWMKDGTPVWLNAKWPAEDRYSGVIDGDIKDVGVPGMPHRVVRLKEMDDKWTRLTGCHFAVCIAVKLIEKREER